jgi:predicted RNA binding protein YcfA (HicA-like mRNA interferase family)
MSKLPAIKGWQLIQFLKRISFVIVRQRGSHVLLKGSAGQIVIVPTHKNKDLPKGLLGAIIKEDLQLTHEEFYELFERYK